MDNLWEKLKHQVIWWGVPIAFLVILLVVVAIMRPSVPSSTTITDLATIMSAVFVVGGLVVVLVSILGLASIKREIRHEVEKSTKPIKVDAERRLGNIIKAYDYYMHARMDVGVFKAEKFVDKALLLYDELSGARYFIASHFHKEACEAFYNNILWKYGSSESKTFPALAHKAVLWLYRTLDHPEDEVSTQRVHVMLAESLALLGPLSLSEVKRNLKKAIKVSNKKPDYNIFCLANAFTAGIMTEARLRDLSNLIGEPIPFPWTRDYLGQKLRNLMDKALSDGKDHERYFGLSPT